MGTTKAELGIKPRSSDAKASVLSSIPSLPSGTWQEFILYFYCFSSEKNSFGDIF